jgi:Uncharacterised protein conserved in bacteria (DUF2336)
MIGFQPYETFQLLVETGGIDRANTLLVAACDAYARRRRPPEPEIEQFQALASRLFPAAAPSSRHRAAAALAQAESLPVGLQRLVIENIGDDLAHYLATSPNIGAETAMEIANGAAPDLCAAIATRTDLDSKVLGKLFQMNSRKVYRALAGNTSIVPRGQFQSAFARSAQMDHIIAERLVARDDFDAALLAPAFFDLSEEGRLAVIQAYSWRATPAAPIKKTIEQLSVATNELTRALMKLFTENRRPEVTRLLSQITGLDDVRCGQISHDTSGAALFVVLRAFGCTAYDGLKVLIHATSHDKDRSKALSDFARMFQDVSADAMAFLLSAWRGDVDLLDLTKPQYGRPIDDGRNLAPRPAASHVELERQDVREAS